MAATLIDTNVLVYAYDRSAPERQRRALVVLDRLAHPVTPQVVFEAIRGVRFVDSFADDFRLPDVGVGA